ncbi:MAG: hypothetical protein ABL901_03660 [Hyphomicrobiaceae bacterium]
MMSILTLALMVLLVATMKNTGGKRPVRPAKTSDKRGDTLILGRGVKLGAPEHDPDFPGKVSYRLMQDRKLPTASQRAWRRMGRPFGWFTRRFSTPKVDGSVAGRRPSAESVELQNFLDARNREIARRKSEDPSKRGPEDTLH